MRLLDVTTLPQWRLQKFFPLVFRAKHKKIQTREPDISNQNSVVLELPNVSVKFLAATTLPLPS